MMRRFSYVNVEVWIIQGREKRRCPQPQVERMSCVIEIESRPMLLKADEQQAITVNGGQVIQGLQSKRFRRVSTMASQLQV